MLLVISKEKTIRDVQMDFTNQFPFLKLEFYKRDNADPAVPVKKHLPHSTTLRQAGLKESGVLDIQNEMTVVALEKKFYSDFGLDVQVLRKSGMLWLETTVTDKWALEKQNEHGREISLTPNDFFLNKPSEGDS
ncbi:MAG: hypothetical protein ACXWC7_12970 [Chitinophagaceae bacterium]